MNNEIFIKTLQDYKSTLEKILSRFEQDYDSISIRSEDDPIYKQIVIELIDLFNDAIGSNEYSSMIGSHFYEGLANFLQSPSYKSVENIIVVLGAAITRFQRQPELLDKRKTEEALRQKQNVFIIHGSDEAKWRELKDIFQSTFRLNPIVLQEQADVGKTLIEKFEHYADTCSYAVAIFTPDDEVLDKNGEKYLQTRPNVIYELGWFCGRLGRKNVMLLLKEGTSIFSDFGGIVQKRFSKNVSEKISEIRSDLIECGILDKM
ncbi:MAG: hypothetical protein A2057_05820 [Ignavibacteria bacterium GWA2_35_9]|nr:MAG: hypothetical protein A2298_01740 [Gammaproteobacteria bacterium RIFOXYB2_FULL_38_6]OGU30185.1 MAG: hypothetical protein A2057_05820 [Ignavibacteria bacterium GWA2_35_9]OGU52206.1 MAG: hypothetical protein A2080_00730 [Ignavibacteria bacterium GWC2_36_12]